MIALQAMRMWATLHTYDKRHADTDSCRPMRHVGVRLYVCAATEEKN